MYGSLSSADQQSANVQDPGHNSLGLLGSLSPENHPNESIAMSHSHSMPAFGGLHVTGMPQPSYGARRCSVSSAASSSCLSLEHASDHSTAYGSYSPRSFTPSESPMNLPGSLTSLSGLALGTPDTPGHADLPPSVADQVAFQPEQHNALLALSHGQDEFSLDMPPLSAFRRRAAHSFDVSMLSAHHGQPNLFGQSQGISESDGSEETTPMPTSTGTFAGQPVVNLSDGFRAAQVPVTPHSMASRASLGAGPCVFTPGQSYSPGSTPDHSIRGDLSNPSSPFYPPSAIALRRLTSADHVHSDTFAPHETGTPSKDTPPLLSLSDLNSLPKHEPSFQANLAFRDHFQSPSSFQPHRSSLPDMSSAGMTAAAMSRVASAPTSSPMPQLSRSSTSSEASSFASFPSTPSSSIASAVEGRRASYMYPSTPTNDLMSPGFDPYYSAPQMSGHRSNSMFSLGSPINDGAFTSMLDGRSRSVSGSVTRTTPRGRVRNAGPPPLIVSSADKLHVCHCGKRFKRMEHLKRHNRTHTQERPHKCPVETCGKFFGRSDNLAQHLKTHFRPAGLVGRSSELLSLTTGSDKYNKNNEPRHDPYAAAAAAAVAAAQAAVSVSGKRGSISQACLGGPIALSKPMPARQVLAPAGELSANSSPTMQQSNEGLQLSAHFA
ncbi:related to C2H2-type zinc finger protein [Sporisorium reilianum SRZ2]|uniref:Related to C2H2-type zinc finger protein n=1 Tax=Sporisorium reilianum (strain SRZ2) TaxID=999809 RepID=E6ZUX4_SPORE|nr:related to C2H2-type zinc finger protein [Sporisorium reilianum SRZ2]